MGWWSFQQLRWHVGQAEGPDKAIFTTTPSTKQRSEKYRVFIASR
jgi:hypothetical protein